VALTATQQRQLQQAGTCELRFDDLTRLLYSTDASIYQIEPDGVAFPRSSAEAAAIMRGAAELGIPIIPRGAGTGLAGGAVGRGLVIDFSATTVRSAALTGTTSRFAWPRAWCWTS